jgi:hypothetical protein
VQKDFFNAMTRSRPRMCSATGCRVSEWLPYPLTDNRKFGIMQSEPLAGTECNSIS